MQKSSAPWTAQTCTVSYTHYPRAYTHSLSTQNWGKCCIATHALYEYTHQQRENLPFPRAGHSLQQNPLRNGTNCFLLPHLLSEPPHVCTGATFPSTIFPRSGIMCMKVISLRHLLPASPEEEGGKSRWSVRQRERGVLLLDGSRHCLGLARGERRKGELEGGREGDKQTQEAWHTTTREATTNSLPACSSLSAF